MDTAAMIDPALIRFGEAVRTTLGDRVERVVLCGARARGDHRVESDYGVAVFLRDMEGLWEELRPLAEITTDILIDTGPVISAKPLPIASHHGRAILMKEIRPDGIDV